MNLAKHFQSILYVCLINIGLLSCSSTKNMAVASSSSDKETIEELKSGLKFKTHFGQSGDMDVKATNISGSTLDISDLQIHIEQLGTETFKSYTLADLGVSNSLIANTSADFHLALDERIESDFGGRVDNYNVSIVYDSNTPLDNTNERNIYYISYKYSGK